MRLELSDYKYPEGLAFCLLNLFCAEDIFYLPDYESWGKQKERSTKEWLLLPYSQIIEMARLILLGLTQEKQDLNQVKKILIIVERWVLQSSGNVVQVAFDNGNCWFPTSHLKIEPS